MGQRPDIEALLTAQESPEVGKAIMGWFAIIKSSVSRGDMFIGGMPIGVVRKAPQALRKAAQCGVEKAWLALADWLANPPIGESDPRAADDVLQSAIADRVRGAALALVRLRWFVRRDDASSDERKQAYALAKDRVEQNANDCDAIFVLALLVFAGFGTEASPVAAFALQQRAAALGNADALFELFIHHETGAGTAQDSVAALDALRRAAAVNHPRATYNMGAFHATGRYLPKDLVKAVDWYTRSSQAGNPQATATLAVMYAQGEGVTKDLERARELFDEAEYAGADVDDFREAVGL